MTTPTDTSLSNQLYLSRDNVRNQIIEYMQYYLELENVDLVKSSFLTFMIDTLSTLTTNILFYSSSTYKEFFLTTAQLPETIFNLSAFLGYNPSEATYATANVLITMPLTFTEPSVTATIPAGFNFSAGSVKFVTYFDTTIVITNNSNVVITAIQNAAKTYNLPVIIDSTSAEPTFSFLLPISQYTKVIQEFQIDQDTPLYQFVTIDVPLTGKVSTMEVWITDPGSNKSEEYTEIPSVYLMTSADRKYVSRSTVNGRRLVFGNSIIGWQPAPGSTVEVTTYITEGLDGNVIPSSIKTGDRIYADNGKIINYTVTNTSPAIGGKDEESLQDIRSNSISSLVALNRLVSEYDYQNAGAIMPNSPIAVSSIPVLKRSDVKCNEIQLFSIIEYGSSSYVSETTGQTITSNSIAPTRNAFYTIPVSQIYIPRETIITIDSVNYYTLFDIDIDLINLSAYYTYILYKIDIVPTLTTSYGIVYDLVCSNLNVLKTGSAVNFTLSYASTESDFNLCSAQMIVNDTLFYEMPNDPVTKKFTNKPGEFDPYTKFPDSNQSLDFNIYRSGSLISTWTADVTFRKKLDNFMMSNLSSDGTNTTVYDIPVIQQSYYDDPDFSQKDFELNVLQTMMNQMSFNNHSMLTDFTNLKFTNTVGTMINMKYNLTTKNQCVDIGTTIPPIITISDCGILNSDFEDWTDSTSCDYWTVDPGYGMLERESVITASGVYSAKITGDLGYGSGIYQDIQNVGGHNVEYWRGKTITLGFWVNTSVVNKVRPYIQSTVGEAGKSFGTYHTGYSEWQFLTVTHTIPTNATQVNLGVWNEDITGTIMYVDVSGAEYLPGVGDRYIIGYTESGEWANKNNQIAQCILVDSTSTSWYYFTPVTDDIVYVINTNKKYIYNGYKWIMMEYQIPLLIDVEIFKNVNYYGTDIALVNLVKDTLLQKYSSSFGPNITLYKSDIISTIQGIAGVSHCNLIKPESNLFFRYTLEDLTEQELLEYSPEYVFFTENSISVKIYS